MTASEYLDRLGDLLGEAREELEPFEFLKVLSIEKVFCTAMFDKETQNAGLGRLAIEAIEKAAHDGVSAHLRSVGIEM